MTTGADIDARLTELVRVPVLLVACDYDGTLAPIVDDPAKAHPHRESVAALRNLADLADTHVAVISGRALRDLAVLSRLPDEIHLVGSHGSEFDVDFLDGLPDEQLALRDEVRARLTEIAETHDGFSIEPKPAGAAFHYRQAPVAAAEVALEAICAGPGALAGVHTKHGKKVLELSVTNLNKGNALDRLRQDTHAGAVIYLGDDRTDEDAFDRLCGADLGLKVGAGETVAQARLDDTRQVAQVLAALAERRRAWLMGEHAPPIERHSLLSDQRTVALLTPDASVTWLCHPRADSPAVFAGLVGGERAGKFTVARADGAPPLSHRYVDRSMVVETRWPNIIVTDYLDCSKERANQPAGRSDLIRTLEGTGEVVVEFAPRLDYGRAPTGLHIAPEGLQVTGAAQTILLHSPGVAWTIHDDGVHQLARAEVQLDGTPLVLQMSLGLDCWEDLLDEPDEPTRRADTISYWKKWASSLTLPNVATEEVRRSALTLKALCHQPSGSILAAATTSLPEVVGGIRNWDYRYCWPRDASMTATSLISLGSTGEAVALLNWILDRVEHLPGPDRLRPVYPLVGDEAIPEAVLPELPGYAGSRPVRIGNAAENQLQLDVFGPIMELAWQLHSHSIHFSKAHWELVQKMVEAVNARWDEPDHGIWEERRPPRHHVHSKVMCWMAVDRAIRIADRIEPDTALQWSPLRHLIAADVVENGWNEQLKTYTSAYGDEDVDASLLWLGLSGLLAPQDPRLVATVKTVEEKLRDGPVVYRYRHDDGLPGTEGGFLICTAWLIETYVLIGLLDDARALFSSYLDFLGPTGLMPEEYDPEQERLLGNHPQAYSHLGLIDVAVALAEAEQPQLRQTLRRAD